MAAVLVMVALPCTAQQAPVPSFPELEAAGAVIGAIHIRPQNIFDLDDLRENTPLYRLANRLHVVTRPSVIERDVLFKTGERVSARVIDETERLLRSNRFLHDVWIRPIEYRDCVVDIEIVTRDTWSLDPGLSISRAGGANAGRVSLKDHNIAGSGISAGISYSSNVDRAGTELGVSDDNLFGNHTAISYAYAVLDVGKQQAFAFGRPFYALDTRWAAGISSSHSDALTTVYENGAVAFQYRAQNDSAEVYGGWSTGRVGSWVQRVSAGLNSQSNTYAAQPGQRPPPQLPEELTLAGPFLRYQVIEEGYERVQNRDRIGTAEFVNLGLQLTAQLGRTFSGLGSTQQAWLYSLGANKGLRWPAQNTLLAAASVSGRLKDERRENQLLSASLRYFITQGAHAQLTAAAAVDVYLRPDTPAPLQLGGDTGLRGYPLSFQSGERRALVTLEERWYSDWYPYRLIRVGGAVFADCGRAWNGVDPVPVDHSILCDTGFGLRLQNARSAYGNVAHIDLAFPLNRRDEVRSVQLLVGSKATF